jgi:hypothetical protein
MNAVLAFVVVMAVWTFADFVAKKTASLLSSLFVASIIFLVGYLTGIFPEDLLPASVLLPLGGVVVGFIIVHLGTLISVDDFKRQWRTFIIGIAAVVGIGAALAVATVIFGSRAPGGYEGVASAADFAIAGTGAISGATISVLIVQEAALDYGLTTLAIFPVLIAALQQTIGIPLTSIILRKEAVRLRDEYRAGNLVPAAVEAEQTKKPVFTLPDAFRTTAGMLFTIGVVVLVSTLVNDVTDGLLNTFVVALLLGIALRAVGILPAQALSGINSLGLMMISIMIIVFAPLAGVEPADVKALAFPLFIAFAFGLVGIAAFAGIAGRLVGFTLPMSLAIGLTALFGFPGTMILSQEAARGAGEDDDERSAIEGSLLPKMVVAGFSTVTITSVIVTSLIAGGIGR